MDTDAERAAREKSRAVWDAMAAGWEAERDWIWDGSRAVGEWLVDKLAPRPGNVVLELAAGVGDTGFVAARLVGESGRVIVTDFAPEMVAAARRRATELGVTNAEFRVLDAEQMDLPAESVDGVLCRWGYMLMANPLAAFSETRRVLRRGGTLAFSVFAGAERNPWASLIGGILVARGCLAPPDPTAPGIFALADPERVRALVTRAGFAMPVLEPMPMHLRFTDFDAYWRFLTGLAGAISPVLRSLPAEEQAVVQAQMRDAAAPFTRDGGYEFPALCLNAVTS